jgi:hypothetical protein
MVEEKVLSEVEKRALLQRFEPVLHFTQGERFFPMDVDRYVRQSSLWMQIPDQPAVQIVPEGELTLETLAGHRPDVFGAFYFMQFIEPPDLLKMARLSLDEAMLSLRKRNAQDGFRPGRSRLARVGFASRLVDAVFSISLLLRGRVPGDTAIAAAFTYRNMQKENEQYAYFGRVLHERGWWVLQYWYFYPFNNWRSGFDGVNDHEADWEMVTVYCFDPEEGAEETPWMERLQPKWVAYASHEHHGDDLRRRWDDPELKKLPDAGGWEHPVVYVGAGSHAGYFLPGEYMTEIEVPFISPMASGIRRAQVFVKDRFGIRLGRVTERALDVFRVPFIDYARGDGLQIGFGNEKTWQLQLLDEQMGWAAGYRGLWGWYAQDPIAGENAPAGPVYQRDGSVRRSWCDPLGWCGLDRIATPAQALQVLAFQQVQTRARLGEVNQLIESKGVQLVQGGVGAEALHGHAHLAGEHARQHDELETLSEEIFRLRQEQATIEARLQAYERHAGHLKVGEEGAPDAHLHHPARPSTDLNLPLLDLAEFLAAASIGTLMIATVLLIVFARQYALVGLGLIVGVFIFFEAGFRGRLFSLINSLSVGLALAAMLVLLYQFFWQIVAVGVFLTGIYLLWENLREVIHWGRGRKESQ